MKDGKLRHARDIGRVNRRAAGFRRSRETNLIIDDDVNRAARPIAAQLRELQRLHDDALSGKRRVAVQQNRQCAIHRIFA